MSKLKTALALVCLAFALAGVFANTRAAQIELPAGQGVELARAKCLTCHEADLIAAQKLTRAGWVREVEKMVRWGAKITDEEKQTLADYFATHFAPVKPAAQPAADNITRGQAIYEAKCLLCHEDTLIKQQRLARAGWVREIEKMTRWGATVKDEEKDPLADYLFKNYGSRPLSGTH